MTTRMLIDARHREETRVAVVKGNRIEEFDFESAEHRQLKGNIYLAKVTRVEPSLQAAFIDYGGNRHGFLAFSEIHPDYYQIPKEDREALLREEAEHAAEEERLRAADDLADDSDHGDDEENGFVAAPRAELVDGGEDDDGEHGDGEHGAREHGDEPAPARPVSADHEAADELRRRRQNLRRRYKIQDVIRRRQVLLVQVVKEERGNKGAALTTYLSLAGRYCVLMPNTSHGGGISRKISNGADRKRLKAIMADLDLPRTMGCIVRTAGLSRTKTEIKRDFDYLARLWDEIRENTLGSSAPALIYQDSDLIKRAIRDIYNTDIDEVIVEGEAGYKAARAFMKLLMPSHVKKVRNYVDPVPLFQRYGVEDQLAAMYQPLVQLKSGGYLVINPTEALVSIDINSGRSTREHNIEQTAFATNIEAAHEIARQLRLRDMAGLVVIDFIDMEQSGHVRKVEKAMKDALKNDRARIQVGRISSFGLMEMSRQRLRTGVLEASTRPCAHCEGTGLMRTAASAGLSALRMLEDEAARGRGSRILLRAGREAAIYVLNRKRHEIAEVEERYGVEVEVLIDESFEGARMTAESLGPPPVQRPRIEPVAPVVEDDDDFEEPEVDEEELAEEDEAEGSEQKQAPREPRADRSEDGEGRRKRRRRRGRRGGKRREGEFDGENVGEEAISAEATSLEGAPELADASPAEVAGVTERIAAAEQSPEPAETEAPRRGRRRPRARSEEPAAEPTQAVEATVAEAAPEPAAEQPAEKPKRSRRRKADAPPEADTPTTQAIVAEGEQVSLDKPAKPRRTRARKVDAVPDAAPAAPVALASVPADGPEALVADAAAAPVALLAEPEPQGASERQAANEDSESAGPPRRGWWQRTFGA